MGDVECVASGMHWKMDQSWVQVVFRNTRSVIAAAEAVCLALMSVSSGKCWFREAATGSRFLLRKNQQLEAVTELWHGTTVPAGLAILRDGIKAKRGGDPRGVYGLRNLENVAAASFPRGQAQSKLPQRRVAALCGPGQRLKRCAGCSWFKGVAQARRMNLAGQMIRGSLS